MTGRVWEQQLWTGNAPLPNRRIKPDHPIYGLPRQYVADGQALIPWSLFGLVEPVPPQWQPLPEHHEAAYLTPPAGGLVRIGLVDYAEGTVTAWLHVAAAGSTAYQQRRRATRDDDEPSPDPLNRPRRSRARQSGTSPP